MENVINVFVEKTHLSKRKGKRRMIRRKMEYVPSQSAFPTPSGNNLSHSARRKARGRRYIDAGVRGRMCEAWISAGQGKRDAVNESQQKYAKYITKGKEASR